MADRLPLAQTKYRGLVYGAFLGTALFEVPFFGDFRTNVEAIFLGFLVLPVVTFAGTLLGALFGLLIGWFFQPKTPTRGQRSENATRKLCGCCRKIAFALTDKNLALDTSTE